MEGAKPRQGPFSNKPIDVDDGGGIENNAHYIYTHTHVFIIAAEFSINADMISFSCFPVQLHKVTILDKL